MKSLINRIVFVVAIATSGFLAHGCAKGIDVNGNGPDGGTQTEPCKSDKLSCGEVCVDPLTDPKNCGECGRSCGAGQCHRGFCRCWTDAECLAGEQCVYNLCRSPDSNGASCATHSDCGSNRVCVYGRCATAICEPEVCDSFDNDCNGQIDEPDKTTKPCYTGPKGTEDVGECHGGTARCVAGTYFCEGEQRPVPETGVMTCDDKDNNCDGCVDGAGGTLGCDSLIPPFFDFVFMLDTSGSMSDDMATVKMVVETFSAQFAGNDRIHAGIMDISTEIPPTYISVVQPLSDWATFKAALDTVDYLDSRSFEAGYDAIHDTALGVYDAELGFRPGSLRIFIMLTDEKAQSYKLMNLTESEACAPVLAKDVLFSVVTLPKFYKDWDECAPMRTFPLTPDIPTTVTNLNSILVLPCFDNL